MFDAGRTRSAARGKWRGILQNVGIDARYLVNKHGPCPVCHGKDRFRFDDKQGSGSWFCSHCGAGDGFDLAKLYTGREFREVADMIDGILSLGPIRSDPAKPEMTEEQRLELMRELWRQTAQMQPGDLADVYLQSRGVGQPVYGPDLRFGAAVRDGEGGKRPVMAALVRDPDGKPVTLHRTFLRQDGKGKAEMPSPRKMMPGSIPQGSAVRLMEWAEGPLGVAEGIETAFAASDRFGLPVWAALNATMLARFQWPEGCTELAVFGDADGNFVGHAAAFELAKRASLAGLSVSVHVPGLTFNPAFTGTDWADKIARLS